MVLNISGASGAKKAAAEEPADTPTKSEKGASSMGFIKKGAAAQSMLQQEQAKAEAAKAEKGKLFRFRIREDDCGDDFPITFLDGDLDEDGLLDVPMFKEHTVQHGGKWQNFVCIAEQEPCPLCESGDNASLVGVMTVLDRTPYTIKNGDNAGKVIETSKKLFVAKRSTIQTLQKYAAKNDGLAGLEMEVSRTDGKKASVGDVFLPGKKISMKALKEQYGDLAEPADLDTEITPYSRKELLKMGIKGGKSVGGQGPSGDLESDINF